MNSCLTMLDDNNRLLKRILTLIEDGSHANEEQAELRKVRYKIADGRTADYSEVLFAMLKTGLIVEVDEEGNEHRVHNINDAATDLCKGQFGEPIKNFTDTYSKGFRREKPFGVFHSLTACAEQKVREIEQKEKAKLLVK